MRYKHDYSALDAAAAKKLANTQKAAEAHPGDQFYALAVRLVPVSSQGVRALAEHCAENPEIDVVAVANCYAHLCADIASTVVGNLIASGADKSLIGHFSNQLSVRMTLGLAKVAKMAKTGAGKIDIAQPIN